MCVVVVLVVVVVVVVEGGQEEGGWERLIEPSGPTSPQEKWSSTASSGKANDWRTRENVVLDLLSNLK